MNSKKATGQEPASPTRRRVLSAVSKVAMVTGLAGGYGAMGAIAGRYLYPAHPPESHWIYVSKAADLGIGDSIPFEAPSGEQINVTRIAHNQEAEDFIALSSTCPHLGCQVHWESLQNRFFCPCHNGTFDLAGQPTGGPPAEANQPLPRFPLRIENGMLFLKAPSAGIQSAKGGLSAPGHDACLGQAPNSDQTRKS